MSEATILESIQIAVTAAVAASIDPDLPVKYVGRILAVPDDGKYLEVVHIPNNNTGDFWGNEKNHAGIFRLALHWPNDDSGPYGAVELLESIGSYFYAGQRLQNVVISGKPDLTGVLEQGAEVLYPASVRYNSFEA